MTIEKQSPSTRPAPVPDQASRPFFDAAAEGRLLIRYCPACARYLAPAADFCDTCHAGALEWRQASGRATLYSFVINHQVLHPGFAAEVPFNVIIAELAEGPRLTGNYIGENTDLEVNMALQVTFEQVSDVSVPKWRAALDEPRVGTNEPSSEDP